MKVVIVTHRGSVEKVYVNNKRIEKFETHDEAYHGRYKAPNKKKKELKKIPIKPMKYPNQMKMWITLTPVDNINKEKNRVINNEKNFDLVLSWDDGIEVKRGIEPEIIQVKDISKDDIFLHDGSEYRILRMISKKAFGR